VLVNYLIRLAVEKRGEEYLSFPRRALLDRIGIRSMVMETDRMGFSNAGIRAGVRPRLGASRESLSAGRVWQGDGFYRRLRAVRQHCGSRLGRRDVRSTVGSSG